MFFRTIDLFVRSVNRRYAITDSMSATSFS
jgi:hypothetical protein